MSLQKKDIIQNTGLALGAAPPTQSAISSCLVWYVAIVQEITQESPRGRRAFHKTPQTSKIAFQKTPENYKREVRNSEIAK